MLVPKTSNGELYIKIFHALALVYEHYPGYDYHIKARKQDLQQCCREKTHRPLEGLGSLLLGKGEEPTNEGARCLTAERCRPTCFGWI